MRKLIVRTHPRNALFGLEVGWRIWDPDGNQHDIWWGCTKNEDSLRLLLDDARKHYPNVELEDLR